jgi:hypothetical protein
MHPEKAKALATLLEIARVKDELLRDAVAVVRAPGTYGWEGSLLTATMLPLIGVGAMLNDLSVIMLTRSADATWEKAFPGPSEP